MKELNLVLVLRHIRVLPKLFMLLERLGADCLDVQGQWHPGAGGKIKLVVGCPPALEHRVKTQIERLVDVTEMRETPADEPPVGLFFPKENPGYSAYAEGKSL